MSAGVNDQFNRAFAALRLRLRHPDAPTPPLLYFFCSARTALHARCCQHCCCPAGVAAELQILSGSYGPGCVFAIAQYTASYSEPMCESLLLAAQTPQDPLAAAAASRLAAVTPAFTLPYPNAAHQCASPLSTRIRPRSVYAASARRDLNLLPEGP